MIHFLFFWGGKWLFSELLLYKILASAPDLSSGSGSTSHRRQGPVLNEKPPFSRRRLKTPTASGGSMINHWPFISAAMMHFLIAIFSISDLGRWKGIGYFCSWSP